MGPRRFFEIERYDQCAERGEVGAGRSAAPIKQCRRPIDAVRILALETDLRGRQIMERNLAIGISRDQIYIGVDCGSDPG